jgi:hypothetical protein
MAGFYFELKMRTKIESLITRREAMKAANEERRRHGNSDAYGEAEFESLVDEFENLNRAIIEAG